MLYKLIEHATSQDKVLSEIATKSSLGRLISKKLITRTHSGYQVTTLGATFVRSTFNGLHLDSTRIELLNYENRGNSSIQYDRLMNGTHL